MVTPRKCAHRLTAVFLATGMFLLTLSAGAAQSGITVTVQDGYQADYGVTIPFTRSPRTTDYTFSLYEGAAAGAPAVSAEVKMTAAQGEVYLPFAYDITGPQSYTLKIEAHPLQSRIGTDTAAAKEFSFTTQPTCGCAAGTAGAFYRGNGSASDPFYVATPQQLAHVGVHNTASHYQDRNITLSGNWTPIASFSGTYDGGGHKITELNVSGVNHAGLFEALIKATIKNLGIESTGTIGGFEYAGAFSCLADTTNMINCYAVARVSVTKIDGWPTNGGLIGAATNSLIEDSYFAGCLQSANYGLSPGRWSGGLCGGARSACTIRRTWNLVEYSIGSINNVPNYRFVGGIVGVTGSAGVLGPLNSSHNYWGASGSGVPAYGVANTHSAYEYDSGSNDGCTQISSFSSLPAGFDPLVWEMGMVTVPTLSGGSKTVSAPVLKAFQS